MLHFSKSVEETNSFSCWMAWGWVTLQQIVISEWTLRFLNIVLNVVLNVRYLYLLLHWNRVRFIKVFSNACFISSWSERETRKTRVLSTIIFLKVIGVYFTTSNTTSVSIQHLMLNSLCYFKSISTQRLLVYATYNYKVNTPIVLSACICSQVDSKPASMDLVMRAHSEVVVRLHE